MLVRAGVGVQNSAQNCGMQNKNKRIAFKGIVADVAKDSQDVQVEKNVKQFFDFMKNVARKAMAGNKDANQRLTGLIGEKSATALVKNPGVFTAKADASTKLIPLSGLGTRGAEIRNKITSTLGQPPTHKAVMPLPAVLGEHNSEPVRLNTVINEFLHMMQAGIMSPFEKLNFVRAEKSDGDLSVVAKGIAQGVVPTDKPAILTYTDDIGTHGHRDYENLINAFNAEPKATDTKVITVGFEATQEEAADKLGTFLPEGGKYRVFEKPSEDTLKEHLQKDQKVLTNIGKILFTPKGLADIKLRSKTAPASLTKMDKGEPKLHVTEGVLKPAGEEGSLKVIPKTGNFSDVGNGPVFTDKMLEIAEGKLQHIFPEVLEKQIAQNVKASADGKSATLIYGKNQKVELPTSKA